MTTCQLSSMPRGWGCETAETRTARKPWEIEDGLWERVEPLLPVMERTIFMSNRGSDVAWDQTSSTPSRQPRSAKKPCSKQGTICAQGMSILRSWRKRPPPVPSRSSASAPTGVWLRTPTARGGWTTPKDWVAGRISATLEVGAASGKVTTVRAPADMSHAVNVITKIDGVTDTGEVTVVEPL